MPIRILLLVENNAYPYDVRVRNEAHALRDAGYQVAVIAPRSGSQRWTEDVDGIEVYRFPAPPEGNGALGYALEFVYATLAMLVLTLWIMVRRGINVIHAANPPDTLWLIGAVGKLFGKRFIFDVHDLGPEIYESRFSRPHRGLLYWTLRFLERCSYAVADVVIATNESYRKVALARGCKQPDKVFVVRNGPPLSYRSILPNASPHRSATHLIGYVGTIGPQDGLDYWLRAIHKMVAILERRDFRAIIIGDGDALPRIKALAKELEVEPYVCFTGRLPPEEVRKQLSPTTICVQPDPSNPLNDKSTMVKLMEYMALGKPTVAFDLTETRFSAQEAALYAQPNDELEFAQKVCWLLDHPEECRRMGEIGRNRIAKVLAWEYSVPGLLSAYREVLGVPTPLTASRGTLEPFRQVSKLSGPKE